MNIILIMSLIMGCMLIFMVFILYPFLFYPVKANIYSQVKGGLKMRTDEGKYIADKVFGRVIKFNRSKDFTTNKRKVLEKYNDADFIIRGKFLPKRHLNVFEKSDGTWLVMPLVMDENHPLFKLDLRDIMPTFVAEQQETMQSMKSQSWLTAPIVTIAIVGIFVIVLIVLGTTYYTKQVDKAVAKREAMAADPKGFCSQFYAPYSQTGTGEVKQLEAVEGADIIKIPLIS